MKKKKNVSFDATISLPLFEEIEKPASVKKEFEKSFPAPYTFSRLAPAITSEVFDTYWRFAAERQQIFFRRLSSQPGPWSEDSILTVHKFTNAYRASDRVSQYLIKEVIYNDALPRSPQEVFFRIMLFKLFNKIETWELLKSAFGSITYEDYSLKRYDTVLAKAKASGARIYSAAYIMPPGGSSFGMQAKHQNHLLLLERMIDDRLPERLAQLPSMQTGFEALKSYPTIGDFLAYQFITDLNYSELTNFGEMDFVIPGPGARDGLRKCFTDPGGLSEPELIRLMADIQEEEFDRLGLEFKSIWGRRLQLIDCQNLFCEVDKYARVAHPDVIGITGRSRIKQKFKLTAALPAPFYPPKWGLNDQIKNSTFRVGE